MLSPRLIRIIAINLSTSGLLGGLPLRWDFKNGKAIFSKMAFWKLNVMQILNIFHCARCLVKAVTYKLNGNLVGFDHCIILFYAWLFAVIVVVLVQRDPWQLIQAINGGNGFFLNLRSKLGLTNSNSQPF
jgi:hypothetical protein